MKHKTPLLAAAYIIIGLLTWGYKYNRIQPPPEKPTPLAKEAPTGYRDRWEYWKMEMRDYSDEVAELQGLAYLSGLLWPAYFAVESALWATKPR